MKKIMMLVAVAFAACVMNAASVDWKVTAGNMYAKDGTTKYTGTFELYATGADLTEDVLVYTFSPVANGAVANKAFSTDTLTVGESYNSYYVLTDGSYTFTSAATAGLTALETGAATINFGNQASATQNAANWSSADVPEPTSGLLLLLGVAGLALRRKQK